MCKENWQILAKKLQTCKEKGAFLYMTNATCKENCHFLYMTDTTGKGFYPFPPCFHQVQSGVGLRFVC